jgi:hypothetical protein
MTTQKKLSDNSFIKKLLELSKNRKDLTAFTRFVHSDYHNRHKNLRALLDVVLSFAPKFDVTRETTYKKLYPDKNYNEAELRTLLSQLGDLLEKFFIFEAVKKNKALQNELLVQAYHARGNEKAFEQTIDEIKGENDQEIVGLTYAQQAVIYSLEFWYHSKENAQKEAKAQKNLEIARKLLVALDSNYLIEKLKISLEILFSTRVYKTIQLEKVNFLLQINALIQMANIPTYSANKKIYLYALVVRQYLISNEDIDSYNDEQLVLLNHTKEEFEQYYLLFDPREQRELFLNIQNHILYQINSGQYEAYKTAHQWYAFGLKYELLFDNKKLSTASILNISNIASVLKDFTYVDDFLAKYGTDLNENAKHLCLAIYYFNRYESDTSVKEHLQKAIKEKNEIEQTNLPLKIIIKNLEVKILLHEVALDRKNIDKEDEFTKCLALFEQLLMNKLLSEDKKRQYRLLISSCRNIHKILDKKGNAFKNKKEDLIAQNKLLFHTNQLWVLNFLNDLQPFK